MSTKGVEIQAEEEAGVTWGKGGDSLRMKAEDEPETCEHAGAHQRPGQMQNQELQEQFGEQEINAL